MAGINQSKKNRYILIIIGMLLIAFSFSLGRFSNNLVPGKEAPQNKASVPISDNRTFFWEIYPDLIIPNSGKKINDCLSLLDSNDRNIQLADALNDFPILLFRYSKFDCHICVNQVLQKLSKLFKGNEGKVCLLVDGYTAREMRIKYRDKAWKFPIYILDEKLGLSLENKNLPFMFVFENNRLEVNKIFVPFKEHSSQTDMYLQNIVTYLQEGE